MVIAAQFFDEAADFGAGVGLLSRLLTDLAVLPGWAGPWWLRGPSGRGYPLSSTGYEDVSAAVALEDGTDKRTHWAFTTEGIEVKLGLGIPVDRTPITLSGIDFASIAKVEINAVINPVAAETAQVLGAVRCVMRGLRVDTLSCRYSSSFATSATREMRLWALADAGLVARPVDPVRVAWLNVFPTEGNPVDPGRLPASATVTREGAHTWLRLCEDPRGVTPAMVGDAYEALGYLYPRAEQLVDITGLDRQRRKAYDGPITVEPRHHDS
ncbi:hypothetical protein GCM10023147_01640 [Tsukamurella soli]|uniref:Uncharacterized protein n=2 Tax=Tsukamurella soli TaxID=644556 RepID=A0ABP8J1J4_9ACTN